jgi:tRNA(fMet)-specific endonuclease VapC
MNGNSVALDTNIAVHLLNDAAATIAFLTAFSELYLPVPVIGELQYGATNSAHPKENLEKVRNLVSRCKPLAIEVATAEFYSTLRFDLKRRGRPIPENDIWIAAICVQHNLSIATEDQHFSRLPNLRIQRP